MGALRQMGMAVKERFPLSVITDFFVYSMGRLAIIVISIVMAPVMMMLLSPAEYGLLSLIYSFENIAIAVIGLGLPQVLMVEYFHAVGSDRIKVLNSIIGAYLVCMIPLFIVGAVYPGVLQGYLFIPERLSLLVYVILVICFFSFLNDIMFQILQYNRYAVMIATMQLVVAVMTALLNIICVGFFHYSVGSIVMVQCLMVLGTFTVGLYFYCSYNFYKTMYKNKVKALMHNLKLGIPFLPNMMGGYLFSLLNQWMVARYAGLKIAGIYAVADAGGQLFYRLILHPLQAAYGTSLLHSYTDQEHAMYDTEKSNQRFMALVLIALILFSVLGYVLFKPLFYYIIPVAYAQAVDCVLGILIGYIFLIGAFFVSNFIQFQKKRFIFVFALALAAGANSILSFFLIPYYGLSGSVIAMVVGYGTYFAILLVYNRLLLKHFNYRAVNVNE